MWDKRAEYLSNKDGNSVKMVLDQGFGDTKLVTLRLLGINAPELSEKGGPEVQAFVSQWFADNEPKSGRWGFLVTTSRLSDDRYAAVISNLANEFTLNAEVSEFIYANGFAAAKKV